MTKHHFRLKETGWKTGAWINGIGAVLSLLVLIIVASMKFTEGAWVIMLLVPIMVVGLVRLNRAYEAETEELHEDAAAAATTPTLRRHAVVVLVDNLDVAAARAMQYAKTLLADDLRAVHFDLDAWKTEQLTQAWQQLGFSRFPLDIIECPDRRVPRAALELAAQLTDDDDTELTIIIPRREYVRVWHRLLHDRSSNSIAAALGDQRHCTVTIVPYHLGSSRSTSAVQSIDEVTPSAPFRAPRTGPAAANVSSSELPTDRTKIAEISTRRRTTVAGRVRSMRIQPWAGNPALECTLADETGSITVVFFGRREIGGVGLGTTMSVVGVPGEHHGKRAMLNPEYSILTARVAAVSPDHH